MNYYSQFSNAASYVSKYWTKGHYESVDHKRCLVGAVGGELGYPVRSYPSELGSLWLPHEVVAKIDAELEKRWGYRLTRRITVCKGQSPQAAIEKWNDRPWRRKKDVYNVLNAVAESEALEFFESEILRLSIEISSLREQIADLKVRIALIEAENKRLWRKLLGDDHLEDDRIQLEALEAELEEKAARMEKMETAT